MSETTIMRTGDLAYYESCLSGMLPVKILGQATHRGASGALDGAQLRVTATRGAYRRGMVITAAEFSIIPRSHVITSRGVVRVVGREYKIQFK